MVPDSGGLEAAPAMVHISYNELNDPFLRGALRIVDA